MTMLADPNCDEETKSYIRERIRAAKALQEAVANRQNTIRNIAQAIIDAQPDVFEKRTMEALRPLTMQQVADVVGVHGTTVSRTVRDKYMSTPFGTVEMRRFFAGGLATESGETVTNTSVQHMVRDLIAAEDPRNPLSDDRIAAILTEKGIKIARRTVAKYRIAQNIPGAIERRAASTA
jgi:RNA polymerase sigma-54 factor